MAEPQDVLEHYRALDRRCLIFEVMIFISYLFVLLLSWFAKKEQLALLGVLRMIRLLLVTGEIYIYISGVRCRKKMHKLRRCMNYTYYLYGLKRI